MTTSDRTPRDVQRELSGLLREYAGPALWYPRHPLVTVRIVRLLLRVPVVAHRPGEDGAERRLVARALPTSRLARWTVVQQARHVLELPRHGSAYNAGPARATQRRKARVARKLGVTSRLVTDRTERLDLLAASAASERTHPQQTYRELHPDNTELLDVDLWMAAYDAAGRPIMLVIIPVDGNIGALSYFRTLAHDETSSATRYLMTELLAEELVRRDVHYLADHVNPLRLRPGLFHFAQMVGYRVVRLKPVRLPAAAS